MATDFWFQDPGKYGKELTEANIPRRFCFTERSKGYKFSYRKWLDTYFPDEYEALVLNKDEFVLAGIGPSAKPAVTGPVWRYDLDLTGLEELTTHYSQVVVRLPDFNPAFTAKSARVLAEFQKTCETPLHIVGLANRFPLMFGLGLKSVTGELEKEMLLTPYGKREKRLSRASMKWAQVLGFLPVDLEVPRNRLIYNARSFAFAAKYWNENLTYKAVLQTWTGVDDVEVAAPGQRIEGLRLDRPSQVAAKSPGDKVVCNKCAVAKYCKHYRVDSVCSLSGSDVAELANFFRTRDAESVISGLSEMLARGSARLERGLEAEESLEELDPEVSRIFDSLFDKGVKLAKLMDPTLNKPAVGVTVNTGGQNQINGFNPKALVANVVRELESRGISRDQITPEMLTRMLGTGQPPVEVLENDPRTGKW
jgi:hypothetical protein